MSHDIASELGANAQTAVQIGLDDESKKEKIDFSF